MARSQIRCCRAVLNRRSRASLAQHALAGVDSRCRFRRYVPRPGIPEATVKTRMFYARRKLAELVKAA
jgi:hypothetical protein